MWILVFVLFFFMSSRGWLFKNTISHEVHALKSSAANNISLICQVNPLVPKKIHAWCKHSIEFYRHGISKLGDHASFSGTLINCNLLYKITKKLGIQHVTVNRPIRLNYRYSRPGKLKYRYRCSSHVLNFMGFDIGNGFLVSIKLKKKSNYELDLTVSFGPNSKKCSTNHSWIIKQ